MLKVLSVPYGSTATFAGGVKTAIELEGDTITQVVGWAGDGATFDIGFQALSAAAERNENIIYVCCDNEGYMNTGNQRSSASPKNITTSTTPAGVRKAQGKKEIALIMARHKIPYVCTATVAYPNDFMSKVIKAKEIKGFRFFHVLCPCPTGWKYLAQSTVKISRLAVATRVFPLFEAESGDRLTINEEPEKEPLEEYIKLQGRYNDMSLEQIEEYKNEVEERWEFLQRQTRFGEDADGVSNK
jgi:pyruvate ferredoxin oxidoreductase beta subunit/2-oxoisovalerate ferredoxin oxidoreductase beta subunit